MLTLLVAVLILTVCAEKNETFDGDSAVDGVHARNLSASVPVVGVGDLDTKSSSVEVKSNETDTVGEVLPQPPGNIIEFNHPKIKNKTEPFRPSPQLEGFYEFNRTPVKPVHPEPRKPNHIKFEDNSKSRHLKVEPEGGFHPGVENEEPKWISQQQEAPWVTRVMFPTGPYAFEGYPSPTSPGCCQGEHPPTPQTVHNFVEGGPHIHQVITPPSYLPSPEPSFTSVGRGAFTKSHQNFVSGSEEFNFNKLVDVPKKYIPRYQSYHKTHDYNLMEKPHYEPHERHGYGLDGGWKKILKLLVTFIPVGLLISALTPTVITVTNVNDTTDPMNIPMAAVNRYRSVDDSRKEIHNHILSSLDYFDKLNENGCEYRVFCELLVSAGHMADSEQQVQNLLDNFAKQDIDYKSRADDLKKVFEAVRNHDCNSVPCALIKNPL